MADPTEILDIAYAGALARLNCPFVTNSEIRDRVEFVARNLQNRAGVRLLLAVLLAKVHRPEIDIRKPYTAIGGDDTYSGRHYDEAYVEPFVFKYALPCNPTTAFLTPALRNRNAVLTPDLNLVGRPPLLYQTVLLLLADVHTGKATPRDLLAETIRWLLVVNNERGQRINTLLTSLKSADSEETLPLSSEDIIALIQQHLSSRNASRLPVLVVTAAYRIAGQYLRERVLPLESHTSADKQTGALGDVQITLIDDENIVTSYEMKTRRVTRSDIDRALQKIASSSARVDNYLFITTDVIDDEVQEYARSIYERTGGIEVALLGCLSFLRYFLHLFHRYRGEYLEAYQELVLAEPDSAVSQPLKEAFLALRQVAESGQ